MVFLAAWLVLTDGYAAFFLQNKKLDHVTAPVNRVVELVASRISMDIPCRAVHPCIQLLENNNIYRGNMSTPLNETSRNYYTQGEAAKVKGVCRATIWKWVKKGKLPAIKVDRRVLIRKDDLAAIE